MGKLDGFSYCDIIERLKHFGFEFHRQASSSHLILYSGKSNQYTTISNHTGDMPERTLRAILKQANISIEELLNQK